MKTVGIQRLIRRRSFETDELMRKPAAQVFAFSIVACSFKEIPAMSARLGFMIFVRKTFFKNRFKSKPDKPTASG